MTDPGETGPLAVRGDAARTVLALGGVDRRRLGRDRGVVAAVRGESVIATYHRGPAEGAWWAEAGARRSFRRALRRHGPDLSLIVWSWEDEREGVWHVAEDTYVSGAAVATGDGWADEVRRRGRFIPFGSDEHLGLWATAVRRFSRDAAASGFAGRLVVVPPRLDAGAAADEPGDGDRTVRDYVAPVVAQSGWDATVSEPEAPWPARDAVPRAVRRVGSGDPDALVALGPRRVLGSIPSVNLRTGHVVHVDGRPVLRAVLDGDPARYVEVDLRERAVLREFADHRHKIGAALLTHSSGDVYGSFRAPNDATLWRLCRGSATPEELGSRLGGEMILRNLREAPDGAVLAVTYPGGRLLRLDAATDEVADLGQVTEHAVYAWGLGTGEGEAWVGTGPRPGLIRIDLGSGARRDIPLPADWQAGDGFVLDVHVLAEEVLVGFAVDPADGCTYRAYHHESGAWRDIGALTGRRVRHLEPSPDAASAWGLDANELREFPLRDDGPVTTVARPLGAAPVAVVGRGPDGIALVSQDGSVAEAGPAGDSAWRLPVAGTAATHHSLARDPHGRVLVGTYLGSGVVGIVDRDAVRPVDGPGQVDSWAFVPPNTVLMGAYPGVQVHQAELATSPADGWAAPPRRLLQLGRDASGQDRPTSLVVVDDLVFIGTVATYGRHQGAVVIADRHRPAPETTRIVHVAADQSVTALVRVGDTVVGATSVHGALGTTPVADRAAVFALGTDGRLLWSASLPTRTPAVVALVAVDEHHVAALGGDGVVLLIDLRSREVVRLVTVGATHWSDWGYGAGLVRLPGSSVLLAHLGGRLLALSDDLATVQPLLERGAKLALAERATVYVSDGSVLSAFDVAPG